MASIWTEDPQSLASELESDAVTTLSREDAVHAVASKIWTKTPIADWTSSTRQKCVFESLPVKDQMFEDMRGNINHLNPHTHASAFRHYPSDAIALIEGRFIKVFGFDNYHFFVVLQGCRDAGVPIPLYGRV